ncbi:Utp14 protein-domain-containing protein [Amylostereum chailletii]|nr:Utp14 protein-domain-containing protein [Amylostereum chailletii]
MARPSQPGRKGKALPSVREANAAGYAKRHSRKAKDTEDISEVYEFQQQRVRRDKVTLTLDREEAAEFGVGSDDEIDRDALRARLIGENVDDEQIDEDDDEELDSDAAFEESDEERFAGFSFASSRNKSHISHSVKKKRPAPKYAEVNLNESDGDIDQQGSAASAEDEDEEVDGNPEDFLDILDVLDGRADAEMDGAFQQPPTNAKVSDVEGDWGLDEDNVGKGRVDESGETGDDEDEEDDEEDEDAGGEDEEGMELSAEEDIDEDAVMGLGQFVSGLDTGKKRKASDDHDIGAVPRKKRVITEQTQTGQENEFAAYIPGSSKLKLDDLLAPLTSQSSSVLALRKSAKALASSRTGKTLSAPLPQRTQDRLDREAAYEQTKEEVDKWNNTMKQIKEAEHLSFPLQAKPIGKTSNLELAAKFKPTTEMESSVDKLLKQAQMREEDLSKTEELKMNHLSIEEVAARRAEVRKVRELMFRAEAKAKRMAKIKSKTYRRIKKKEREKLAAQLGEDDDDDDEDAAMKREVERARERATLRHKNTGKWAKAMRGRGELDDDQRQDVAEMLDRGEKLRRKIQGQKDSDASEGSDSEEDEENIEGLKARAFEELQGLKEDESGPSDKIKGVFDMKFMRDAATREQADVSRQVDDFVQALDGLQHHSDDETGEDLVTDPNAMSIERIGGRVSFRPGNQPLIIPSRPVPVPPSDTSSTTLKSTDFAIATPTSISAPDLAISTPGPSKDTSNPWLSVGDGSRKPVLKKSEIAVGRQSKAAEKSKGKLNKRQQRLEVEKAAAMEDAMLEISPDNAITLDPQPPSGSDVPHSHSKPKAASGSSLAADDSDGNSEVEEQEKMFDRKGKGKGKGKVPASGIKAFEQRNLVAMAFAGDNVVQDFEEAKRREIQADAPKEVDTSLPGWGAWGGQGARKQAPKPHFIKKVAGVDPKSRADHGKKHVIISEKRDKKASKYMVKDLPFPYTSKSQFERGLDTPIGTEWSTRVAFQRATLPKVTKKMGVVINPLQKKVQ